MDDAAIERTEATALPPGGVMYKGRLHLTDVKGRLVPYESVKAKHLLEDELVRKVFGYAKPLSEQIARFRRHTFDDVDGFVALLEQEHGAKKGGSKGNMTFTSYDGLLRVQVAIADKIEYGAELQVAKGLIDDYLTDLTAEAAPEIRTLITDAFNVDQAGRVNRASLLSLRRYDFKDNRWLQAMDAIRDAERPVSSKRYVRIYRRPSIDASWEAVSIDMATV